MGKKVPVQDRNTSPVITMLPLALSKKVERLAKREDVSKSEIGRRAIVEYFEKPNGLCSTKEA